MPAKKRKPAVGRKHKTDGVLDQVTTAFKERFEAAKKRRLVFVLVGLTGGKSPDVADVKSAVILVVGSG
jgi:hypothetical protein